MGSKGQQAQNPQMMQQTMNQGKGSRLGPKDGSAPRGDAVCLLNTEGKKNGRK